VSPWVPCLQRITEVLRCARDDKFYCFNQVLVMSPNTCRLCPQIDHQSRAMTVVELRSPNNTPVFLDCVEVPNVQTDPALIGFRGQAYPNTCRFDPNRTLFHGIAQ
jgi:hypothetical protein